MSPTLPKVYLAGGFHSGWQESVIEECSNRFVFFDPRVHSLGGSKEYTSWDLHHVSQCDILFAFMEPTNPSGFGLSLEVGFARALNKTIILVDGKSSSNQEFGNYFKMIRESSNVVFDELIEGIEYLRTFGYGFNHKSSSEG